VLSATPGEHWLVLGDMGELGEDEQRIHFDAGIKARKSGVSKLLTIGEASQHAVDAFGENAMKFSTKDELISKGSRFMKMEQIVESLIKGVA